MSFDSDSSDSDDGAFQETAVLLGYALRGAAADEADDPLNQLGGRPTWPSPTSPPSAALARCSACRGHTVLLLQLNANLPEHFPTHERRLYVFGCRRKACRRAPGALRVLRCSTSPTTGPAPGPDPPRPKKEKGRKAPPAEAAAPEPEAAPKRILLGNALFGVSAPAPPPSTNSPLAPKPASAAAAAAASAPAPPLPPPPQTKPAQARPAVPDEPWPSDSALPPAYPRLFLEAEYETLSAASDAAAQPPLPANYASLLEQMETEADDDDDDDGDDNAAAAAGPSAGKKSGQASKQADEPAPDSTVDKAFNAFARRIGQNAEQVLRYEFGGAPLLYSDADPAGKLFAAGMAVAGSSSANPNANAGVSAAMPRCESCGSLRKFELQLVPNAIAELERDDPATVPVDGMEWGTVIVGVCQADCVPEGSGRAEDGKYVAYVEEYVAVQWEEQLVQK